MTLKESAERAVLPWNSMEAESTISFDALPQQSIDICLMCQHCASHCDICYEWNTRRSGRPKKEIDYDKLREMMALKRCNKEMCAALGVSKNTLIRAKKLLN